MATLEIEPVTDRHVQAATILARSVCLTLSCHYLGNHRKVDLDALIETAMDGKFVAEKHLDEQQFHVTKKLVDGRALRPVMRVFGKVKDALRKRAIPAHRVFGERAYLIPLDAVSDVDADLVDLQHELDMQAIALSARYADEVAKQAALLGPLMFRAADYPTTAQVRNAFSIDWSYVSFAAPDRLESVDHALAMRADAKHQARLADAFDEVVLELRGGALRVMRDLAERLSGREDGKPKVLRGTVLRDLQDFLASLPTRNIVGDDELSAALARVAALADGLGVDDLRDTPALRRRLADEARTAVVALDGLLEASRGRAISFGPLAPA